MRAALAFVAITISLTAGCIAGTGTTVRTTQDVIRADGSIPTRAQLRRDNGMCRTAAGLVPRDDEFANRPLAPGERFSTAEFSGIDLRGSAYFECMGRASYVMRTRAASFLLLTGLPEVTATDLDEVGDRVTVPGKVTQITAGQASDPVREPGRLVVRTDGQVMNDEVTRTEFLACQKEATAGDTVLATSFGNIHEIMRQILTPEGWLMPMTQMAAIKRMESKAMACLDARGYPWLVGR